MWSGGCSIETIMTIISSVQWVAAFLCRRTQALGATSSPRHVLLSHRHALISGIRQATDGFPPHVPR